MAVEQRKYRTKEIAELAGVHVNTVRFYEEIEFLTKPEREKNGYRIFTDLHLDECRLIRIAMRSEVLQNGLRKKAIEIVKRTAALQFDEAYQLNEEYLNMLHLEVKRAKAAIAAVEKQLQLSPIELVECHTEALLKRREAAEKLGVTSETLRTWERSGLLSVRRQKNGYRLYSEDDMQRLNIIRTLRCADFSLSAILRMFEGMECNSKNSVERLLNTPGEEEDIISVCDRLIVSLNNTIKDAILIRKMLYNMKEKYITLQ